MAQNEVNNIVKRQGWGESCSIRLWEREAYVLNGARTSPKEKVRESKHAVKPRANSTGPCGRPHGRQIYLFLLYTMKQTAANTFVSGTTQAFEGIAIQTGNCSSRAYYERLTT
jgi:hypothetical protein